MNNVNITKEINAFTAWVGTNNLDATAQALWMHLLDIWNQSGSPEWIEVANPILLTKLGVTDKPLTKYRSQLVDSGRIEYEGLAGKKGGKYKIHPFHPLMETFGETFGYFPKVCETSGETFGETDGDFPKVSLPYIDRWIEGLQEGEIGVHTREVQNPIKTFEKNFAKQFKMQMNKAHYEMLKFYLEEGMSIEVALLALEDAMNNDANTPKYLWTIFGSLIRNGVFTVPAYAAYVETQAATNQAAAGKQGGEQRGKGRAGASGGNNVVSITNGKTGWVRPTADEV